MRLLVFSVAAILLLDIGGIEQNQKVSAKTKTLTSSGITQAAVARTYYSSFYLAPNGMVWAWGENYGKLGDGDPITPEKHLPVLVHGENNVGYLTNVVAIATGMDNTFALRADGSVVAWGDNSAGELGDGTITKRSFPMAVKGVDGQGVLTDVKAIKAGDYFAAALKNDGSVLAWGENTFGRLGDGTTIERHFPVPVLGEGGAGTLGGISQIIAADEHVLALKTGGSLLAWGNNHSGQLGDGSYTNRYFPVAVHGENNSGNLNNVSSIAAGWWFSLALKNDGSVRAWGTNGSGQLADGTFNRRNYPGAVKGKNGVGTLSNISAIRAGTDHGFALQSDHNVVWAWGENSIGQLGVGSSVSMTNTPLEVHGKNDIGLLTGVNSIDASSNSESSSAFMPDGTLLAWGLNYRGQLGDNTTIDRFTPIQVKLPPLVSISPEQGTVSSGGEITYNLTVKNLSPDVLSNQPLTIGLPSGTSYVLSSGRYNGLPVTDAPDADNYNFSNNQASWTVLTLAPSGQSGETVTASFKVRAN